MTLLRRTFLQVAALTPALAAAPLKKIGVQLYTVRDVILKDPRGVLKQLDEIGYREAEVVGATLPQIWDAIKSTRLQPVSVHLDSALFKEGREGELDAAIADAKRRGFTFVVYPYLPPAERGGLPAIRKLAAQLNSAGKKCRAAGLKLCYHNHAFEFDPKDGSLPMDVLIKETDPKLVGLELDIFWVSVAGHDPAAMLKQHADRVPLLHLKNKAPGTPVRYNEGVAHAAFKEVGAGEIDIPAVLRAAKAAGVQHYFVEQDRTQGNPVDSLRQSYQHLSSLKI